MRLAEYLRTNNLDDAAFGAVVGSSEGAVKKWRYGERIPRPDQMARIREATGGAVTADDFYAPSDASGAAA